MSRWVVEHKDGKTLSLPMKILEPKHAKAALSPLAWKILQSIMETPSYPKELGKKLKVHEQKIYYHIRNLTKAGLIKVVKEDSIRGITAKYYGIEEPAFGLVLKEMEHSQKIFSMKKEHEEFLSPFVEKGELSSTIILGSPEPHGIGKARAKDGPWAINLGLFLGSFINYIPSVSVKLDTEASSEDLKNNLILIGGPGVNKIVHDINDKLPVRFHSENKNHFYSAIHSTVSKKKYAEEENGLIVKMKNPFAPEKHVLVIAGRRATGTKAAILAFMHKFDEICAGNAHNLKISAKVVEGIDKDSDGIVDTVEIKE